MLKAVALATLVCASFSFSTAFADLPDPPPCKSCFVGTLHLSPNPKDQNTRILSEDLYFVDADGLVWKAGKGDVTDGASIPPLFQPIIGGPWEADYLPAAVMHDHYCDEDHRVRTWRGTDRMFYEAMLVNHTDVVKAKVMYYAVYAFGPHWDTLAPGKPCGGNCVFSNKTGLTFQPADYSLSHRAELNAVENVIRDKEVRGTPLSLDDLEGIAVANNPLQSFLLPDNSK